MNSFDKVIGYKSIKRELLQICDMIRNRTIYEKMGARLPHGLLLYGDPGLGKSLLANCFMEECGLNTVTVRRDKGGDAFINSIAQAFAKAKEEAPSVLLLDDMDKFANEDSSRCDAPEYVAVQAGIDDVKETAVFVIATANEIRKLPDSLCRSGRFDRKIRIQPPTAADAEAIIAHYLSGKQVSDDINMKDLTKMMSYPYNDTSKFDDPCAHPSSTKVNNFGHLYFIEEKYGYPGVDLCLSLGDYYLSFLIKNSRIDGKLFKQMDLYEKFQGDWKKIQKVDVLHRIENNNKIVLYTSRVGLKEARTKFFHEKLAAVTEIDNQYDWEKGFGKLRTIASYLVENEIEETDENIRAILHSRSNEVKKYCEEIRKNKEKN